MKNKVIYIVLCSIILILASALIIVIRDKKDDKKTEVSNSNVSVKEKIKEEFSNLDKEVIEYFENVEEELKEIFDKDKAKDAFISTVDFLFYDGEVKGVKLKDLTDKGKLEVSKIITKIENSIENKFPGAIDETKEKYSTQKTKIVDKYNNFVDDMCNKNGTLCNEAKEEYENIKKGLNKTLDYIKDIKDKGKEKVENWYSNFKEENK